MCFRDARVTPLPCQLECHVSASCILRGIVNIQKMGTSRPTACHNIITFLARLEQVWQILLVHCNYLSRIRWIVSYKYLTNQLLSKLLLSLQEVSAPCLENAELMINAPLQEKFPLLKTSEKLTGMSTLYIHGPNESEPNLPPQSMTQHLTKLSQSGNGYWLQEDTIALCLIQKLQKLRVSLFEFKTSVVLQSFAKLKRWASW